MALKKLLLTTLRRLVYTAAVIFIWSVAVKYLQIPEYILPAPQTVAATFAQDMPILAGHFNETFKHWSIGLAASVVVALLISLAAFQSRRLETCVDRFLVVSQAVPYLTIAPLLLLWLGLGAAPKIVLILLTCTFPIAQLTLSGLHSARGEYSVLATILRFNPRQALIKLYTPAALPDFMEGVRISVTYAFVSAVLAELIGSESGLGVYLSRAQSAYRTDRVLTVVLIIVFFSLFCTWLVNTVSRKLIFWKPSSHAQK